ncbi:LacI family transcriptional regulator [Bacillus pumilus]|uniref:LacI family DNA-binding transcriptional regulator n=1 Tax=Bacillus safensis TaxID=561879 RepID=UPI0006402247|nr:LacI family DNA-binding transcriptional regulator [Bacillus safensis]KLK98491.1 LacI family transcriptional regulator [Bacillus pumilus]MBR0637529.1 LacI family DNA-binding transcriptional regulator [Bacillus safensis]
MAAKIKDIAEKAGLSIATVSRVLNQDPNLSVTDQTREKVYAAAEALSYQKKTFKHSLKKIAFLYWMTEKEELEDIYFKSIRLGIEELTNTRSLNVTAYNPSDGLHSIDPATEGIIAIGRFKTSELDQLYAVTPHIVFIDTTPDEDRFDSVKPNLKRIVQKIIDSFIEKEHSSIGFIGGTDLDLNTNVHIPDIRETTFREYMLARHILNERLVYIGHHFSVDEGYSLMMKAIDELGDDLPTAFCVASDPLAIGCLQALNERGFSLPNRVSVFSINDIHVSQYVSPPLTTYHIHTSLLCETAIDLLLERLVDGRTLPKTVLIASEPVFRKSTI